MCGEMEKITEKKLVSVCGSLRGVDGTLHTPHTPTKPHTRSSHRLLQEV